MSNSRIEQPLAAREARIGWRIAIVLSALSVASLIAWAAAEWCNVPHIDGVERAGWAP